MTNITGQPISDTRAWRPAELAQTGWTTGLSAGEISDLHVMADALPSDDASWLAFDVRGIITPAVEAVEEDGERSSANAGFVQKVVDLNAKMTVDAIRSGSAILKEMEDNGEIKIVAAVYDINTGKVALL